MIDHLPGISEYLCGLKLCGQHTSDGCQNGFRRFAANVPADVAPQVRTCRSVVKEGVLAEDGGP